MPRHSFASLATDLGYNEPTIATLLGHKTHSITSRYVHLAGAVLLAAADAVATETLKLMGQVNIDIDLTPDQEQPADFRYGSVGAGLKPPAWESGTDVVMLGKSGSAALLPDLEGIGRAGGIMRLISVTLAAHPDCCV